MASTAVELPGTGAVAAAHLARWRSYALARFGHPDAITILTRALNRLDSTFVRAETALRGDLATARGGSFSATPPVRPTSTHDSPQICTPPEP